MGDVRQDITQEQAEWRLEHGEATFAWHPYGKRTRIVALQATKGLPLVTAADGSKFHSGTFFAHNFGKP